MIHFSPAENFLSLKENKDEIGFGNRWNFRFYHSAIRRNRRRIPGGNLRADCGKAKSGRPIVEQLQIVRTGDRSCCAIRRGDLRSRYDSYDRTIFAVFDRTIYDRGTILSTRRSMIEVFANQKAKKLQNRRFS